MKNRLIKDILVLLVMLAIIVVICIFLPEKIPVHFNEKGVEICLLINITFCLLRLFRILLIGNLYAEGKINRLSEYVSIFTNSICDKSNCFKR